MPLVGQLGPLKEVRNFEEIVYLYMSRPFPRGIVISLLTSLVDIFERFTGRCIARRS
jgi:hypothetical protein